MISFNLRCRKEHEFEGWFRDSAAFETERKKKRIACPVCGDDRIEKALSAPNIATGGTREADQGEKARAMRDQLRALRRHVEANSEHVGPRFAEEARRIHYGETDARSIHGEASLDDARELSEEGVPFTPIPWIEEAKDN